MIPESASPSPPSRSSTDATSVSLLHRVRQRDDSAWERFVNLYSPLIFSWCKRCGLGSDEASDVTQEVFASVAKSIDKFRREKTGDTFRGWLRVITRNHVRGYFRKLASHPKAIGGSEANLHIQGLPDDALDESDVESAEETKTLYHRVLQLLQSEFEERTWKAFVEMTVQERSASDVAAGLGMTVGAVRQAKYKVLRRLRDEFSELLD